MLNMADQTNAAFASMPLTFSQAMNDFKTNAEQAFKPVLEQINEIANSRQFQNFANFAVNGLAAIATAALNAVMSANSGFGVICGKVNVAIQFFKNLGLTVRNIALGIGNALAAVASNMMTAFHNAICSVQSWFYNLLSTACSVIESIAAALNKLPFVEFDYSGITSAADNYAAKSAEAAGNKEDYTSVSDAFNDGFTTFDTFQDGWISNAFNAGAAWGDGVADKVSNAVSGFKTKNTGDTAKNTASAAKSLSTNSEDLKYIRDMAEQKYINRFTTAEIKVSMTNHNNVSSDMDLDGIADHLKTKLEEEMEATAKGVYE